MIEFFIKFVVRRRIYYEYSNVTHSIEKQVLSALNKVDIRNKITILNKINIPVQITTPQKNGYQIEFNI